MMMALTPLDDSCLAVVLQKGEKADAFGIITEVSGSRGITLHYQVAMAVAV